ncbi:GNAT family N-acetyltransferase [Alicyclobacillus sp. SO9]|uniref:GNAT family N-acetyltransferase n=1 Tax=Alicyclobacillus sp. SO9 TaxID=2665646 RepID=UPI0018E8C6B7|nr:GNAT family N-acetyltransferase [Alicyclobacillus sp. SO9]QQE81046.1 GNAT family N-acetyltransferase [Alicyclobacillus sp. SO9]
MLNWKRSSDKPQITLHEFDRNSPLLSFATRVYCKTWGHPWYVAYNFISQYARYPGFVGVVATTETGKVVAMGFGADAFEGNWWFDHVQRAVGTNHPQLEDAWVLVELSVLKRYRDCGVGTRIIQYLLSHQSRRHILLSTQVTNTGARRLYERFGWIYLHDGLIFAANQEPYVIMCKDQRGTDGVKEKDK